MTRETIEHSPAVGGDHDPALARYLDRPPLRRLWTLVRAELEGGHPQGRVVLEGLSGE